MNLRTNTRGRCTLSGALALVIVSSVASSAFGAGSPSLREDSIEVQLRSIRAELHTQEKQLKLQRTVLKKQQAAIVKQSGIIDAQKSELRKFTASSLPPQNNPHPIAIVSASDGPQQSQNGRRDQASTGYLPTTPVGEAPEKAEQPPQVVQSLPEGLAVLTPRNRFVVTPSLEFTHTSNDRLVYRGVVIVPGINIGEVDASSDARNIGSVVADLRYGVTSRLELEARVPFVWSDDRATVLSQGPQGSATQSIYLQDAGIGDVEVGARYQINKGLDDWPIILANARVKTDTGLGPFDIRRDAAGIAQQVALGSGFMGLEGGFSVLKLSDPAVLFGSVNYIYNIPKDINQLIGTVMVGRVEPSNSVSGTMGFGFSINPDFSFSIGYEHSYVFPQYTVLGGTHQQTTSLQVGALTMGAAYRLSPSLSFNTNFEFGVTSDAPDMRVVFSFPTSF